MLVYQRVHICFFVRPCAVFVLVYFQSRCHGIMALWHDIKGSLVMTNIAMGFRWPIEIDGLPMKNGDFP